MQPLRVVENRQPQRAALRGHRDVAGRRIHRGERRVQAHRRVGVQQAHAVGTDQSAARRAHPLQQRRFARASFGVALAEAGADDADRPDALGDAVVDRRQHLRGRHHDDRQIDRPVDVARRARYAGSPPISVADGWTGTMRAREAGRDEVVQDLRPDLPALAVRADDGDHRGSKNPFIDAAAAVRERAAAFSAKTGVTSQIDDHVIEPVLNRGADDEPRIAKHIEHPAVAAQHLGVEVSDAAAPGRAARGAPAGASRCRGPAPHRRRRRRPRRDRPLRHRGETRQRPRSGHRLRRPGRRRAIPGLDQRQHSGRRRATGSPETGSSDSRQTAPRETAPARRHRRSSAGRRHTVDPSRTTTSIAGSVVRHRRHSVASARRACSANFSMR